MEHIEIKKIRKELCVYFNSYYSGSLSKTPNGWVFETPNKWVDLCRGIFYCWDGGKTFSTKKELEKALDSFFKEVVEKRLTKTLK